MDKKHLLTELPKCPVDTTLTMLSSRWKFLIVKELLQGTTRFNDLKNKVEGISQKVLTYNLREMETNGIITRKIYNTVPRKVEYTLTDIGYSLASVLNAMADWGSAYKQYLKLLNKRNK